MAFTGNFMCTSFKLELLTAIHAFTLRSQPLACSILSMMVNKATIATPSCQLAYFTSRHQ